MVVQHAEILIVGGGIAGLATAFQLAQRGQKGIVVLDREDLPGFYASGHNAGIGRQLTGKAEHTALTTQGRALLAEAGLIDDSGGYLLGAEAEGTAALEQEAKAFGVATTRTPGSPFPDLNAAETLHVPSDGIIDIDAMLRHCAEGARSAGVHLQLGCEVSHILPTPDGFEVHTDRGTIHTRLLVNAAGGWAQALGRMAGGLDLAFQPLRRHLVWSNCAYPATRPWTWWADRPLYFRPESGGLLLCACEEQRVPLPPRHQQPESDDQILEDLFGLLRDLAPEQAEAPIARLWCGLRTFSPDRRFCIGFDPKNPRIFWVAGLGGHGMTSGLAVGRLAAEAILGRTDTGLLSPARFQA